MNKTIITILTSLLLALITIGIKHFLANTWDAKNKRANHAIKVIDAFQPELDAIIQTSEDCRLIMTDVAYRRHDSAIRDFMHHLSYFDRFRLKRLWHRLAMFKLNRKQHIAFYEQYSDCGSLEERKKIRPIIENRIQEIISFVNR